MLENKKIVASVVILFSAYLVDYFFIHIGENTILDLKHGKLKGKISYSRDGNEFYEFLGIPYAQPPTSKLRFLTAKPPIPWTGTLDATQYKSKCMQVDMLTNVKGGNEDCLYLNVFAPKTKGMPSLVPVLVYFHGGHFMNGDAKMFGPKYVMDFDNVILVTVNYRLGSLGFLNAGNKYARGNQGLKDQVQALKWIQENIAHFSGDPNRVILFGHSAGASSAHLHMLSKMSTGLFHGVISASGTALGPFALQKQPIEQAKRLGKKLRCPTLRKTEAMAACLGQADVQRLVESHRETVHFLHDPITMFLPTIESIDDNEAFLTKDPNVMLKKGEIVNNVPWIVGVTSNEGLANAATILRNSSMMREFETNWEDNFQRVFHYKSHDASTHKYIKEFYFGQEEHFVTRANEDKISKIFGDRMHVVPTHNSVVAHANKAHVYLYHFNQPSALSYADVVYNQNGLLPPVIEIGVYLAYKWVTRLFSSPVNKAVSHFDDQTFFFNIPFMPEYNNGDENYQFSKDVIKLFISFASDGKPSDFNGVKWEPVKVDKNVPLKYLEISKTPKIIDEPFTERVKFWNSLSL